MYNGIELLSQVIATLSIVIGLLTFFYFMYKFVSGIVDSIVEQSPQGAIKVAQDYQALPHDQKRIFIKLIDGTFEKRKNDERLDDDLVIDEIDEWEFEEKYSRKSVLE